MHALGPAAALLAVTLLAVCGRPAWAQAAEAGSEDSALFPFAMPCYDALTGAANVSHWLEKPAGKHGFVRVEGGHLVDGAGRRLRLLGMNVCFSMNFPTKAEAEATARRLAALGVNCVRFHHLDNQSFPGGIWDPDDAGSQRFSTEALDRLDHFVAQLKEHGVYSDLNLRVLRQYKAADGFPEPRSGTDKGVDNYLRGMIELQCHYARLLLTHRNPYTGTRYADEPAVALVEINNESSLYAAWNERTLVSQIMGGGLSTMPECYVAPLKGRWNAWLLARYGTDAALSAAWGRAEAAHTTGRLEDGSIPVLYAQLAPYGKKALSDCARFITDVVTGYVREMEAFLKEDLGVKVPVIGTQMGFGSPLDQEMMDVVDVHSYWQHPVFLAQQWQDPWIVMQRSLVNWPVGSLSVFGLGLVGKPLVCSEYGHPFPNVYGAEQAPISAAYAALQDMDGVFYFCWSQDRQSLADTTLRPFFDHHADPRKLVTLPLASALLVQGVVRPSEAQTVVTLPRDGLKAVLAEHDLFAMLNPSMVEQGKDAYVAAIPADVLRRMLGGEMPDLRSPFDMASRVLLTGRLRLQLGENYTPAGSRGLASQVYASDTGELLWDCSEAGRGFITVDTARAKAAIGFVGGRSLELGNVALAVGDTLLDGFAVVSLVAVEGEIGLPGFRGLLSCAGHIQNQGQRWQGDRRMSLAAVGKGPPLVEGVRSEVSLHGAGRLKAWALSPTGERAIELPIRAAGGVQSFRTGPEYRTLWYEVSAD